MTTLRYDFRILSLNIHLWRSFNFHPFNQDEGYHMEEQVIFWEAKRINSFYRTYISVTIKSSNQDITDHTKKSGSSLTWRFRVNAKNCVLLFCRLPQFQKSEKYVNVFKWLMIPVVNLSSSRVLSITGSFPSLQVILIWMIWRTDDVFNGS